MKTEIKTHNDSPELVDKSIGSRFIGYLDATYDDLVRLFGQPITIEPADDAKTDVEWVIQFDTGLIATIYNYKNGPNYRGSKGTPVNEIARWHVGGLRVRVLRKLRRMLNP